jgi:hypothetical protein
LTPAVAAILASSRAGELALPGLRSVSEDVARELVKHPLLALDRVSRLTDRAAAILATHAGASLSLRNLEHVGPAGLAKLRDNVGIALPRRLFESTAPPRAAPAGHKCPTRQSLIAAIEQIARAGLPGGVS